MKKIIIILILLFSSALPAFAAGDTIEFASVDRDIYRLKAKVLPPLVTEKQEYYEVTGQDERELRKQMSRNGSSWSDGNKYDSVTSWRVTWDYGYEQTLRTCSPDSFRAHVEIAIRYPKWLRADDVPSPLKEKWDTYLASLTVHETGHRDMAVEAVEELTRTIADMPAAPTCAELDRKIRSLCHERMLKLNDDAKEYDSVTRHGFVQGAVFP
jgi:predicted secreted Zn-dependent protease